MKDGPKKIGGEETWRIDLSAVSLVLTAKSRHIRQKLPFERAFLTLNRDLARLVISEPAIRRRETVDRIMSHLEPWVREQTSRAAAENYLASARYRLINAEKFIQESVSQPPQPEGLAP